MSSPATARTQSTSNAPTGDQGQKLLVEGQSMALRLWDEHGHHPGASTDLHAHDYEVLGYVISGTGRLHLEDDVLELKPGTSWVVPPNVKHRYEITDTLTAVEASSPPARG